MKNKYLFFCLFLTVVVGLVTSCKKESDLMPTTLEIADKNIPSTYAYVLVDTTNMVTTVYEYLLNKDLSGQYRVAQTGNGVADAFATKDFTWVRDQFTEDMHNIVLYLYYPYDESTVSVLWGSKSVNDGKYVHTNGDKTTPLQGLMSKWPGIPWKAVDATYWTQPDTMRYLNWKQEVGKMTQQQIDKKNQELAQMKDTIKWYNEFFKKEGDERVIDTVTVGKFKSGKYTCIYWTSFKDSIIFPKGDTIGVHTVVEMQLAFNRVNNVNTGSYYYKKGNYSKEYYTDPQSPKATYSDSIVSATLSVWNYSVINSAKKFTVLAKGPITTTVNGTATEKTDWLSFPITGFEIKSGAKKMTFNEVDFVVL